MQATTQCRQERQHASLDTPVTVTNQMEHALEQHARNSSQCQTQLEASLRCMVERADEGYNSRKIKTQSLCTYERCKGTQEQRYNRTSSLTVLPIGECKGALPRSGAQNLRMSSKKEVLHLEDSTTTQKVQVFSSHSSSHGLEF